VTTSSAYRNHVLDDRLRKPAPAATQAPATSSSAQATASANGTEVDVTLADNTIDSSLTSFKVGVPYTFVIKNTGRHAHNFNINKPVSVAGSLDAALKRVAGRKAGSISGRRDRDCGMYIPRRCCRTTAGIFLPDQATLR